jgi:hypothetical protein
METIEAACESAQTNRCEKIRAVKHFGDKKPGAGQPAVVRGSV